MPPIPDHSGKLVARRYRLKAPIGEGGFGRVYRAVDEKLSAQVAVKLVHPWFATEDVWIKRFADEARTAAGIGHPGVVRVTDTGDDNKLGPFTVAELVDGGSLRDLLDRDHRLPATRAGEYVAQAADALAAAHACGVVHRDIKPGNLLIDASGRVRVCDFGIARLQSGATNSSASHTLIGTPAYMSPEQSRGKNVGPATDQYALGIVLYELLAGRPPFVGENAVAIAMAHISDPPPDPPAGTPPHLCTVLARTLAKDPADRYPDAAALAAALRGTGDRIGATTPLTGPDAPTRKPRRARTPRPAPAQPPTAHTHRAPGPRRRRVPLLALAAIIVVLLIGAGVAVALLAGGSDETGLQAAQAARAADATSTDTSSAGSSAVDDQTDTEPTAPPTVDVPLLVGLSEGGAQARLRRVGLDFERTRRASVRQPAGKIVSQRPAAGAAATEGDTVQITVSDGPPPAEVPDLSDRSTSAAQTGVATAGLVVGATRAVASGRPAGTVIRTEPAAGKNVPRGTAVTLIIARAKQWRPLGNFELTADGSTPSFKVSARKWRITYSRELVDCEYTLIDCHGPALEIDDLKGYGGDRIDLGEGQNTVFGPDGPGRFRLTLSSYSGQWSVSLQVEEYS